MHTASAPSFNPAASPESTLVWNDIVGPKYARFEQVMVQGLSRHSDQQWGRLGSLAGRNIIDIGCGFGDTARFLAQLAVSGEVLGLDCSAELLSIAKQRFTARNLSYVLGDAGVYVPPFKVNVAYSRFGLMFFERPVSALKHIRTWLDNDGILCGLVWGSREENPWLNFAKEVVLKHLPPVASSSLSCGPGPFSMADPETLSAMLDCAGFSNVTLQKVDAEIEIGRSPEEALEFQLALGPAGEIVRHAKERGSLGIEQARTELYQTLCAHGSGPIRMSSSSFWFEARV